MNLKIVLSARNFYCDHFVNSLLNPEQFAAEMKAAAGAYIFLEDRICFLNEVLRLGRMDLDSRPPIYHTEEQNRTLLESISLF